MQIKMTSGGMKLLDHGTVFLAETNGDLRLNITADNAFAFTLVLQFEENDTETRKIETRVSKTKIELICKNFSADGTGLTKPIKLGVIDGKNMYFMFWSYLCGDDNGKVRPRKVEYTIYSEQQEW